MLKKWIILGCLAGASFFIACNQEAAADGSEAKGKAEKSAEKPKQGKKLEMYETSELAGLMRKMYEDNLDIGKEIAKGNLPKSFPEDFKTIHTAKATNPEELDATFDALAKEYIKNMEAITAAENQMEATKAYNSMIGTCASCHQIYCQGPLAKINKMRIKEIMPAGGA
jgi:cytochrome c556